MVQELVTEAQRYGATLTLTLTDRWMRTYDWKVTGWYGSLQLRGYAQYWHMLSGESARLVVWAIMQEQKDRNVMRGKPLFEGRSGFHLGPNMAEHRWLDFVG